MRALRVRAIPHYRALPGSASVAACLCLGLLGTGCGLEKPQSPQWNVSLRIPLADRRVDGEYIAAHADIEELHWRPDSGLIWDIAADLDTIRLDERLVIADERTTSTLTLGQFPLAHEASVQTALALSDLLPHAEGVIAACAIQAESEFPVLASFDSVTVAEGDLHAAVTNQLGLTLDSVRIVLSNSGQLLPFATLALPGPIPNGTSASGTAPLGGTVLASHWQFRLQFYTPGGTILSADDKYVAVSADLPGGVRATRAYGIVEPFTAEHQDSVPIGIEHNLTGASFDRGDLSLEWHNPTAIPATVTWTAAEIAREGVPLQGSATLAPFGGAHERVSLAGYDYVPAGTPSHVRFTYAVGCSGSDGRKVTLAAADELTCNLAWSNVGLSSATGVIPPTTHALNALTATVNWDPDLVGLGLDQWDLTVAVTSSFPFAASVTGRITTDTHLDLPFSGTIAPGTSDHPVTTRISIPHGAVPLHPLPRQVSCSGSLSYGDGVSTITLNAHDFALPRVEARAPSDIYIDSLTVDGAAEAVALSSDDYGDRTGHLVSAQISAAVVNRFPAGATCMIRLGPDSVSAATSPTIRIGPLTVPPAACDASGHAIDSSNAVFALAISPEQITLFERDTIWASERITFHTPVPGAVARISPHDALQVTATAILAAKVSD